MGVGGPAPVHGGAGGAPEGAGHLAPGHRRQHAGHGGAPAGIYLQFHRKYLHQYPQHFMERK